MASEPKRRCLLRRGGYAFSMLKIYYVRAIVPPHHRDTLQPAHEGCVVCGASLTPGAIITCGDSDKSLSTLTTPGHVDDKPMVIRHV